MSRPFAERPGTALCRCSTLLLQRTPRHSSGLGRSLMPRERRPWGERIAPTVERMTGIEPACSAWEADVLPMNYIRMVRRGNAPPGELDQDAVEAT